MEYVTIEEVYEAYFDCRKRKRRKPACAKFALNEAQNIVVLWRELNEQTYEIGYSDAFCVTRPKVREVFAADFRDRIVHHLLIMKIGHLFEEYFVDDTYNCRKDKGTLYGVKDVQEKIRVVSNNYTEDCWILKCDIKSFFMSIEKELLWKRLQEFLIEMYKEDDINWVLWLTKMIVMHRPELRCHRKGNLHLWKRLPHDKSLFTNGEHYGMAIGNLTSQIFANFFLARFDHFITSFDGVEYGRYVDDFVLISKSKELLLTLMPQIRGFLKDDLRIRLHPKKMYLQHFTKGVAFIGSVLKIDRLYVGNQTVYNCRKFLEEEFDGDVEKFAQRYNSYMGFMLHGKSYAIRRKVWNEVPEEVKRMIYIDGDFRVVHVRNKYSSRQILFNKLKLERNGNE